MQVITNAKVRKAIYVGTGIGDIVMVYLVATGIAGTNESALWIALSAFIKGLAALNTSTE